MITQKNKKDFKCKWHLFYHDFRRLLRLEVDSTESVGDTYYRWGVNYYANLSVVRQQSLRVMYNRIFKPSNRIWGDDFTRDQKLVLKMLEFGEYRYLYRDFDKPTRLGYLTKRAFKKLVAKYGKRVTAEQLKEFHKKYGKQVSFERAFKANTRITNFLGKQFEPFVKKFLTSTSTGLQIEERDDEKGFQIGYDLDLHEYQGADRWNGTSCMRFKGKEISKFYSQYPAQMILIKNGPEYIGRAIRWDFGEGKHFFDRLYIQPAFADKALQLIDNKYPKDLKYNRSVDLDYRLTIKPKQNFSPNIQMPYVDSFHYLKKDKTLCVAEPEGYEGTDYCSTKTASMPAIRNLIRRLVCGICGNEFEEGWNLSTHHRICQKCLNKKIDNPFSLYIYKKDDGYIYKMYLKYCKSESKDVKGITPEIVKIDKLQDLYNLFNSLNTPRPLEDYYYYVGRRTKDWTRSLKKAFSTILNEMVFNTLD